MNRKQKADVMDKIGYDINIAKDRMYNGVEKLEAAGMVKDAEQLMKMIYKLEAFQNKYF